MIKGKIIIQNVELQQLPKVLKVLSKFEENKIFKHDETSSKHIQLSVLSGYLIFCIFENNICKQTLNFDISKL